MTTPAQEQDANRDFAAATFAIVVLLSATSGIVDAVAFARFGVFVANQTGNLVIVALSLAKEQPTQTQIASVLALVTFTIGVFAAVLVRRHLLKRMQQARVRVVLLSTESGEGDEGGGVLPPSPSAPRSATSSAHSPAHYCCASRRPQHCSALS